MAALSPRLLGLMCVGLAVGAAVGRGQAVAALVVTLALVVAHRLARSPSWVGLIAVGVATIPAATFLPLSLTLGGKTIYLTDLLLPTAALLALRMQSQSRAQDVVATGYIAAIGLACLPGLVYGTPVAFFIQDLRGPIYLMCGYFIASRMYRTATITPIVRTTIVAVWYSLVMILASLVTGTNYLSSGRVEEVRAFQTTGAVEVDATRFILDAKGLAFVGIVLGFAALASSAWPRRALTTLIIGVPSCVITFVALSRQSIVALAASTATGLVLARRIQMSARRVIGSTLAIVSGLILLTVLGAWPYISNPNGNGVSRQIYAFEARVLQGLVFENAAESPGNQWRLSEAEYALDTFTDRPLLGAGVGAAYRPLVADHPFEDLQYGARFIHNLHLWYLAKTGVVGFTAFAIFFCRPIILTMRPAPTWGDQLSAVDKALAISLIGLIVVNFFEPDLHRVGTAPLAGALVGYLAVRHETGRRSTTDVAATRSERDDAPVRAVGALA